MGWASRKKNKNIGKARKGLSGNGPWGFDYGISINVMAVGSLDFNNNLIDARIIGVAYGLAHSTELGTAVPSLTLVGRDETPLRRAFDEFAHWAAQSDADAVDLTFVFCKDGGYKLILSPDSRKLMTRILRYDSVANPIAMQISWIKSIDTTSEPLKQLREFLTRGIKPFLLTAATYIGVLPTKDVDPALVHNVSGLKELLKFNIRFIDEDGPDWERWSPFCGPGKGDPPNKTHLGEPSRLPPPKILYSTRQNRLKTLFPVTLWRAEHIDTLRAVCETARTNGLRNWQIYQALCNSLLSREIGEKHAHFEGIPAKEWPECLVSRLRDRLEMADGNVKNVLSISADEIMRQALLDGRLLLKTYGETGSLDDIGSVQAALLRRNLLDSAADR